MQCVVFDGFATCPKDVLIVEDDPLIAIDFEDTLLGLGIPAVRIAGTVAAALNMITSRAPDFALLDVGLIGEQSFAVAERLESLKIPFAFVTGYVRNKVPQASRIGRCCQSRIRSKLYRRCSTALAAFPAVLSQISAQAWSTTMRRQCGRAASPSSGLFALRFSHDRRTACRPTAAG
jgi:CheY-like chemotaxis protein